MKLLNHPKLPEKGLAETYVAHMLNEAGLQLKDGETFANPKLHELDVHAQMQRAATLLDIQINLPVYGLVQVLLASVTKSVWHSNPQAAASSYFAELSPSPEDQFMKELFFLDVEFDNRFRQAEDVRQQLINADQFSFYLTNEKPITAAGSYLPFIYTHGLAELTAPLITPQVLTLMAAEMVNQDMEYDDLVKDCVRGFFWQSQHSDGVQKIHNIALAAELIFNQTAQHKYVVLWRTFDDYLTCLQPTMLWLLAASSEARSAFVAKLYAAVEAQRASLTSNSVPVGLKFLTAPTIKN